MNWFKKHHHYKYSDVNFKKQILANFRYTPKKKQKPKKQYI